MTIWEIAAAILAVSFFAFLEWRRANRRHLPARLAATVLAVGALALFGLRPTWRHAHGSSIGKEQATLWTPGATAPAPDTGAQLFALPDAVRLHPDAQPVPDAAYLRRHFPTLGTLRILGGGLDPAELDGLRGVRVAFDPPKAAEMPPGISFLRCPREVPLGDGLIVQGRIGGLPPGASVRLTLEAPDGTATHADTNPAYPDGEARFEARAAPLSAAGRFLWRLRVPAVGVQPPADLPLGVAVVSPTLPRVLVLESAPRFDTAALRRWFGTVGGTLLARTQVGQDHYQWTSAAASPPPSFPALDAARLAGFDLLLADARALLALPPAERDALLAAVANTGLGVLVLPDDTLLAPMPAAAGNPEALLPWKLSPLPTDTPGADRPVRLQWAGQNVPTELPIPAAPFEIATLDAAAVRPLISDRQGHTLAATSTRGRGQLALTLVRDTTRWQRENDPAAFAAYWSFLFSRLARPTSAADTTGLWSLAEGDAGPVFADHPLTLQWAGPGASLPGPATVDGTTTLALAPADPAEPGRWRGTFWPRRAGWHRVALASGGPAFDFHVSTADAWPAVDAARRRTATARFAETSAVAPAAAVIPPTAHEEFPPGWYAALLLASAAYLWIERRLVQ